MPDSAERIRQGKAAWVRLKKGKNLWSDWVLVGNALLEGRAIAVRNASARRPATNGHTAAFHSWRIESGFNLPASAHTNLIAVMSALPSIEEWRSTLTETQRLRLNHPSAVLKNYRKAIAIKPAPESVISPTAPAPPTP